MWWALWSLLVTGRLLSKIRSLSRIKFWTLFSPHPSPSPLPGQLWIEKDATNYLKKTQTEHWCFERRPFVEKNVACEQAFIQVGLVPYKRLFAGYSKRRRFASIFQVQLTFYLRYPHWYRPFQSIYPPPPPPPPILEAKHYGGFILYVLRTWTPVFKSNFFVYFPFTEC